jgi:hypothetical protein
MSDRPADLCDEEADLDYLHALPDGGAKAASFDSDRVIYTSDETLEWTAYSRQSFIDLCDGDVVKARMVWERCSWMQPDTVLDQWDEDDDEELERRKAA